MFMTQAGIDKSFDILNEMTDELLCIAREMGDESGAPVGAVPNTLFNAYQEMVVEQIEICTNNLGGKSAIEYIDFHRRTVKHFMGVLQGFENDIKSNDKSFETGKKS